MITAKYKEGSKIYYISIDTLEKISKNSERLKLSMESCLLKKIFYDEFTDQKYYHDLPININKKIPRREKYNKHIWLRFLKIKNEVIRLIKNRRARLMRRSTIK